MEVPMKFEEKIQFIRRERGLSQEELAESLGISRQAVAKWEQGLSMPDVDNLIALSKLLRVSIDKLLKSEEEECNPGVFQDKIKDGNRITESMLEFLCRAKRNTYAGYGGHTVSSRPKSHDLSYEEGELSYLDTYLGGERFSGEEALWVAGDPVWAMNYSGKVLSDQFSGDFLKEALYLATTEAPYRGPKLYKSGDYTYHCIVNGSVEWFQGYEEIFYEQNKIYECYFHGGIVKR